MFRFAAVELDDIAKRDPAVFDNDIEDPDRQAGQGVREDLSHSIFDSSAGRDTVRCPWQNGYCERVVGTLKRECLSHLILFDEAHAHRSAGGQSTTTTGRAAPTSVMCRCCDAPLRGFVAQTYAFW